MALACVPRRRCGRVPGALVCVSLLALASFARAETIYLVDGRVIEAPIIEENDVEVAVELEGRIVRLLRIEIERIAYDDLLSPRRATAREVDRSAEARARTRRTPPERERAGAAPPAASPLLRTLRSATDTARVLAAIAEARTRPYAPEIARALGRRSAADQPLAVRVAAIEALAATGGPIAQALLRRRIDVASVPLRVALVRALRSARLPADFAIELLAHAFLDPVHGVRRAALETLRQRLADPLEARCVLARLDPHGADPLRPAAARARVLEQVCACIGSAAHDALVLAASDPSPICRACAARCLGASALTDRVQHLSRLLEDPVFEVQLAAAEALTRLGRRAGFERLLGWALGGEPRVRERAWRALERALAVDLAHNPAIWRAHFEARFGAEAESEPAAR